MFYEGGIRAVGVDAVAEAADVSKVSIYKNFGSKDRLVAEYLRARDARWRGWFEGYMDGLSGISPKERLLAVFDAYGEWMERESPRGCAFINAFAEISDPDHPAQGVIREQKGWMRDYLARLSAGTGAEEPEELADRLFMLLEGATVADAMRTAEGSMPRAKQIATALVAGP
ncbi:MAG: TetR family transcriptional regulator [Actinobacteria bacterium]|nr:MAG: TetR family transcriptional regulator [Actinomycetota bacterium]